MHQRKCVQTVSRQVVLDPNGVVPGQAMRVYVQRTDGVFPCPYSTCAYQSSNPVNLSVHLKSCQQAQVGHFIGVVCVRLTIVSGRDSTSGAELQSRWPCRRIRKSRTRESL